MACVSRVLAGVSRTLSVRCSGLSPPVPGGQFSGSSAASLRLQPVGGWGRVGTIVTYSRRFEKRNLVQDGEYAVRRNKSAEKREVGFARDLANKICDMPNYQLKKLELDEEYLHMISIASKLNHRVKGRHRQEKLFAKRLLIELDDDELRELGQKVEGLLVGVNIQMDPKVERTAMAWRDAIAAGDKDVETLLLGYPGEWLEPFDRQQLRAMIKKVQEETKDRNEKLVQAAQEEAELAGDDKGEKGELAGEKGGADMEFPQGPPSTPTSKKLLAALRGIAASAEEDDADAL